MKIVVAFEGMDGAGKTSLGLYAKQLCGECACPFTIIGRREAYSSPLVGRLTRLLHEEPMTLSPSAETFVRLAREQERGCLASRVPDGVVVLDRFVLSMLALARLNGQDTEPIKRLLREITLRAQLVATVLVTCPFEIARARVKERLQGAKVKRSRDERFLHRLADFMEEDFRSGLLTGQQWPVDNSLALEAAEEQLAAYLAPYIKKSSSTTRAEEATPALGTPVAP
jgi:thymidylate kinase